MQPKVTILGMDALAASKMRKAELAARVEEIASEDLCDCCIAALTAGANIDEREIEEFFNKCHGDGGKFCGGPSGSGSNKKGPGTRKPDPVGYLKQGVKARKDSLKQQHNSAAYRKVTTGVVRGLISPGPIGTPKLRKIAKTDLSKLTDKDLTTLDQALKFDQRHTNLAHTLSWIPTPVQVAKNTFVPVPSFAGIGYTNWRAKRNPAQQERIARELTKRKAHSNLAMAASVDNEYNVFAVGEMNLPTLAQEIAAAKKQYEDGKAPKVRTVSAEDRKAVLDWLNELKADPEAGLTNAMVKEMKMAIAKSDSST